MLSNELVVMNNKLEEKEMQLSLSNVIIKMQEATIDKYAQRRFGLAPNEMYVVGGFVVFVTTCIILNFGMNVVMLG